ncbi:hypothetical protein B0H63DRAFT_368655, partial [Podospora didyma]
YRILEWAADALNDPIFPEMSQEGLTIKAKNKEALGHQCSDWAKRANFVLGMGLHASRREELIKVDVVDGGHSLGQVMKFAGHRNAKTLVGYYLDDMSNGDGTAAYLGLEPRRDVTEDFRSASMGRNPGLLQSLPAKVMEELEQRQDYVELSKQIENLSLQINTASTEEAREELQSQQSRAYYLRRKLRYEELENYKKSQRRNYDTRPETDDEGDWRRSYFTRIVHHMVPERARFADILALAVPLRSTEGISALEDLIALLTNDSRVVYQQALRPIGGCCPIPSCARQIERIPVLRRWEHVYRCSKDYLKRQNGFAAFCSLCSEWITKAEGWQIHCQNHTDGINIPFCCDPVIFRRTMARFGYNPCCLRNTGL